MKTDNFLRVRIMNSNVVPDGNVGFYRKKVEYNIDGTVLVEVNGRIDGCRGVVVPNSPEDVTPLICVHYLNDFFLFSWFVCE
jgi:hypothetical protein